ncbi:hypothetical protein GCM10022221_31760 [Actinocorallia aurea]
MEDFAVSLCGLIVAEACNVGLVPIEKPNVPALTRARLQQVDQGYLRAETLSATNARLITAQSGIDLVGSWGGGQIASADGLRFTVPVANLSTGHNPIYFGRQRAAATSSPRASPTWATPACGAPTPAPSTGPRQHVAAHDPPGQGPRALGRHAARRRLFDDGVGAGLRPDPDAPARRAADRAG